MRNGTVAQLHAAVTPADHRWQTVVHDTIYVYSAFRDDRMKKGQIKIIGSSRLALAWKRQYRRLTHSNWRTVKTKSTHKRHRKQFHTNWLFPKWLSLNSVNLANQDKIQKWYSYQRHSISDNRYIPRCSGKKIFPLLSLGWYLFTMVSHNGYLTRGSNGNALSITTNGNVSVTS